MSPKIRALVILVALLGGTSLISIGVSANDIGLTISGIVITAIGGFNLGALTASAEGM
jgi:hypothetical protein